MMSSIIKPSDVLDSGNETQNAKCIFEISKSGWRSSWTVWSTTQTADFIFTRKSSYLHLQIFVFSFTPEAALSCQYLITDAAERWALDAVSGFLSDTKLFHRINSWTTQLPEDERTTWVVDSCTGDEAVWNSPVAYLSTAAEKYRSDCCCYTKISWRISAAEVVPFHRVTLFKPRTMTPQWKVNHNIPFFLEKQNLPESVRFSFPSSNKLVFLSRVKLAKT